MKATKLNTPVHLLAQSNVAISGTIDVSATGQQGGPGGFDGVINVVGGTGIGTVNVELPIDTVSYIHVWTR